MAVRERQEAAAGVTGTGGTEDTIHTSAVVRDGGAAAALTITDIGINTTTIDPIVTAVTDLTGRHVAHMKTQGLLQRLLCRNFGAVCVEGNRLVL